MLPASGYWSPSILRHSGCQTVTDPLQPISIGDLVVNLRWPHYGMCLVTDIQGGRVHVHHREARFAQQPGFSWDYINNWVRIDDAEKR